jgi:GNAT superfamily N-acetyltransferase
MNADAATLGLSSPREGLTDARVRMARERVADVFTEIQPLLRAHYEEIAHFQDIPLDPNFARYCAMDEAGVLRIFTARIHDALVGYAIYAVDYALHYESSLQAIQDVLYLAPEHRNGRLGLRLIEHADVELKAEGVQVVRQHVKAKHDFGRLLERLGYELEDKLYSRRLDR